MARAFSATSRSAPFRTTSLVPRKRDSTCTHQTRRPTKPSLSPSVLPMIPYEPSCLLIRLPFPIIILWFRFRERGRQRRSSQSRSCLSLNLARRFGPSGKAPRCLLFFTFLPSSSQRLDGFSYQGVIVEVVPSPNGAEGKIRVEFADESRKIFKPKELSFIRPEKAFDKVGDLLRSLLTIPL